MRKSVTGTWNWWSRGTGGTPWSLTTETGYENTAELYTALAEGDGDALTRIEPLRLSDQLTSAFLRFDQSYVFIEPNLGYVEVKTGEGDWESLVMLSESQTAFQPAIFSLSRFIPSDSVYIRFRAEGHGDERAVIWKIDDVFLTPDSALAVEGDDLAAIPEQYELHHIFPNPFNPATTIGFSLPRNSQVTLKVYDLLGREVETLMNQPLDAGRHALHWTPATSRPASTSSDSRLGISLKAESSRC